MFDRTQRDCVMVAQRTLTPYMRVRILLPLPKRLECFTQVSFFIIKIILYNPHLFLLALNLY